MQPVSIIVDSKEKFSSTKFPVRQSVSYHITADGSQRWYDWFVKTSPKGYWNPLALMAGLRVKRAKCFCLCGCYDDDITTAFPIGEGCEVVADRNGYLSFFANDTEDYYGNNKGSIVVKIKVSQG